MPISNAQTTRLFLLFNDIDNSICVNSKSMMAIYAIAWSSHALSTTKRCTTRALALAALACAYATTHLATSRTHTHASTTTATTTTTTATTSSTMSSSNKSYKIAVLPGDGIGPEVCDEAVKVLQSIGALFGHAFTFEHALCGGAAYDAFQTHLPQSTVDTVASSDAVLFGSVGGPPDAQEDPKVCAHCTRLLDVTTQRALPHVFTSLRVCALVTAVEGRREELLARSAQELPARSEHPSGEDLLDAPGPLAAQAEHHRERRRHGDHPRARVWHLLW